MIINGFNGRNVTITTDGIELKLLMAVLEQATPSQLKKASEKIAAAGFEINATEAGLIAQGAVLHCKRLCSEIDVSEEPITLQAEEEQEEGGEVKPDTIH